MGRLAQTLGLMKTLRRTCTLCKNKYPSDAFRQRSNGLCVWCEWVPAEARAKARYNDKRKSEVKRKTNAEAKNTPFVPHLRITESEFIEWYLSEPDKCHYCGITTKDFRSLQLKRGAFGYSVSWDIDRKDPKRFYEKSNLALSGFMCNMAKASYFTEAEAMKLGKAIRVIVRSRIKEIAENEA